MTASQTETALQTILKYKRPKLYPKQLEAIFNLARYGLIEASTKAGKTFGCMAWLLEQACINGRPGREFWWVAPVYNQTKIAYKRYKRMLTKGQFKYNDQTLSIELPNGALLGFKSGEKPDNLYGEDVWAAVIDEASRCREESWHAIRSTLTATRGPIRCIGNVKGRQNWFYRLCRLAESGEKDMHYAKLVAADAVEGGVLKQVEIESARRDLPENVFRELYLAEPADDGGNPFGLKSIVECVGTLSTGAPVVWGIDLAKSVDWTVCIALDRNGKVCRFERWRGPWGETKKRIAALVGYTMAYIDSTGVGDPIVEDLQRMGGAANFVGFKFTAQSKQMIMEGLAAAIQNKEISYPDGIIRQELETFEYEYTRMGVRYTAPPGLHDDTVCALALAVQHKAGRDSLFNF